MRKPDWRGGAEYSSGWTYSYNLAWHRQAETTADTRLTRPYSSTLQPGRMERHA